MKPGRGTATAVIGAGRLARSILPLLGPAGYPVVAANVSPERLGKKTGRGFYRYLKKCKFKLEFCDDLGRLREHSIDGHGCRDRGRQH